MLSKTNNSGVSWAITCFFRSRAPRSCSFSFPCTVRYLTMKQVISTEANGRTYYVDEVDEEKRPFKALLDVGIRSTSTGCVLLWTLVFCVSCVRVRPTLRFRVLACFYPLIKMHVYLETFNAFSPPPLVNFSCQGLFGPLPADPST